LSYSRRCANFDKPFIFNNLDQNWEAFYKPTGFKQVRNSLGKLIYGAQKQERRTNVARLLRNIIVNAYLIWKVRLKERI
tara:strand:- start:486 stop:722 length:237 start_codon:yes stop_codon:yes gene_type:complete